MDACVEERSDGVVLQAGHHLGVEVAGGADLQGGATAGQLFHQLGVLDSVDAVADAGGTELQGGPDALRTGGLTGVDGGGQVVGLGLLEDGAEHIGGEDALGTGDVHAADHIAQVLVDHLHGLQVGTFIGVAAHAAQQQACADGGILLHAPLGAADGGFHHLGLGQALLGGQLGGKADLGVAQASLGQVLHQLEGDALDGVLTLEDQQGHGEALQVLLQGLAVGGDTHLEVDLLQGIHAQVDALLTGQLPHGFGAQRAVQVQVQLQ